MTTAALLALAAVSACDRPGWTDPERSKGPHTLAAAAPAPRGPPPAPQTGAGTPEPAAWLRPLIGRSLSAAFRPTGACLGNTDYVTLRYAGQPAGVQVRGWGFDKAARRHVPRVLLADAMGRIVGGGEGGLPRPQVMARVPAVTDPNTQWSATAPLPHGAITAYGVVADGAVCALGGTHF